MFFYYVSVVLAGCPTCSSAWVLQKQYNIVFHVSLVVYCLGVFRFGIVKTPDFSFLFELLYSDYCIFCIGVCIFTSDAVFVEEASILAHCVFLLSIFFLFTTEPLCGVTQLPRYGTFTEARRGSHCIHGDTGVVNMSLYRMSFISMTKKKVM